MWRCAPLSLTTMPQIADWLISRWYYTLLITPNSGRSSSGLVTHQMCWIGWIQVFFFFFKKKRRFVSVKNKNQIFLDLSSWARSSNPPSNPHCKSHLTLPSRRNQRVPLSDHRNVFEPAPRLCFSLNWSSFNLLFLRH